MKEKRVAFGKLGAMSYLEGSVWVLLLLRLQLRIV